MRLQTGQADGAFVVRCLDDRLDAASAPHFREAMRRATEGSEGPVVLDLSAVAFLDSSGLGAIVAVMKALSPERRLELAGPSNNVERVFRLTRMDTVFTIHPLAPVIRGSEGDVSASAAGVPPDRTPRGASGRSAPPVGSENRGNRDAV